VRGLPGRPQPGKEPRAERGRGARMVREGVKRRVICRGNQPYCTTKLWMLSLISSLTLRNTSRTSSRVPQASAGSSKPHANLMPTSPAKNGQASPSQTVITKSNDQSSKAETPLLCWPEISIPTSLITFVAIGCTCVGSDPALKASNDSAAVARRNPSAICERQEFALQRNRTLGLSSSGLVKVSLVWSHGSYTRPAHV